MTRKPVTAQVRLVAATEGSAALEALVSSREPEDISLVAALCNVIHPTMVWKYRTRRRRPGLDIAMKIRDATNGRISVESWRHELPAGDGVAA